MSQPARAANATMDGLPIGRYTLRLEKEGFQTEIRKGIVLTAAEDGDEHD